MKTNNLNISSIEDIDEQLMEEFAAERNFSTNEKTMLNATPQEVLQVIPLRYPWALEFFKNGCANNWMPTEVNMSQDVLDWKNALTFEEKRSLLFNLGFFSTAESLIGNNGVLALYPFVTNPESRMYLLRQAFEEALHTYTFMTITETLPIDQKMVFNMHKNIPIIQEKDDMAASLTDTMCRNAINTESTQGIQDLLRNLFGYYVIMEGIWFYGGFPQMLWFGMQNKMPGLTQQIQFILRDESVHVNFGVDLINTIASEYPQAWTVEFREELLEIVVKAVQLENKSIQFSMPKPLMGLQAKDVADFVQTIANRRMGRLGLPELFENKNSLPWLNETMDHIADDNFFERTVRSYRVDGLKFV